MIVVMFVVILNVSDVLSCIIEYTYLVQSIFKLSRIFVTQCFDKENSVKVNNKLLENGLFQFKAHK